MTKLMQWLSLLLVFLSVWLPVLLGLTPVPVGSNPELRLHITLIPLYILIVFGLISAAIVFYRVLTFNDCPEAYKELKREIIEAKEDLEKKGFRF